MNSFRSQAAIIVSATFMFVSVLQNASAMAPPNVLLIMTDDQGWGDLGVHGNTVLQTGRLDDLARQGARFVRFYVSPVCAPTRACLLTGRYNLRGGTHGVTRGQENLRAEETTIAEVFKAAGYRTGCFGKWHNGAHYPMNPNGQGFDEFVGFCAGHWNLYFDSPLQHNGKSITGSGYIADYLTDNAIRFMTESEKPFFCYVPLNTPHSPWQAPQDLYDKYAAKGLNVTDACAYAMVENIDTNVGRMLDTLEKHDLATNTIVLFLTDNGPNTGRYNGPLKGRKGSVNEGGVRVPLLVRWPGKIEAGAVIKNPAAHIDLLPTLAEMCKVDLPEGLNLDGRSFASLLSGKAESLPPRYFVSYRGTGSRQTVRYGKWLLMNPGSNVQLYDLEQDPGEKKNVAANHPDIVAQLSSNLAKIHEELTAQPFAPLPIPVGFKESPTVTMPAHEAQLQGKNISYFGKSGWANDWVTNWTATDSYPAWPIDVESAGEYQVNLHYAAADTSVGSELEVRVASARTTCTIEKAFAGEKIDVPDIGPRKESYMRRWTTQDVGTITLPKGENWLEVRCLKLSGDQVMDLKAVELRMKG
jgi:arylsulfatase A-like enzyme